MSNDVVINTIEKTFKPLQQFTRGWMMSPWTFEYGVNALALRSGDDFWIVGRAGVMGDCTAETAAAVLGFKEPSAVADAWEAIPDHLTPSKIAAEYAGRVLAWGDHELDRFDPDRMERLHLLGRRIVDAAPASLGAIFAGWRRMPHGETHGARVAMTTQVMREMRGAAHLVAVLSVGITPLDAILASTNAPPRTGPAYAERMGFSGPFRDPDEVRQQRLEAELITVTMLEPFYGVLSDGELVDFGELVETTRNAIDM